MPNLTQTATRAENNTGYAPAAWLAPANAPILARFFPVSPPVFPPPDPIHEIKIPNSYPFMTTTSWNSRGARGRGICCEYIEHFDARGMRCVYGRGDHFGKGRTFNMSVWLTSTGRILARFWARRDDVDWLSLEVIGLPQSSLPNKNDEMREEWVPQCVRDEYDDWILSEF